MDIRFAVGSLSSYSLRPDSRNRAAFSFKPYCSRKDPKRQPEQNGDNDDGRNGGGKFSTDWDKAWSSYRKQGKKTMFSQFSDKYVSWNPRRSDYPLSEEIDPIRRTEKSNLMLWTSRTFTLGGAVVIVTFLLIYTILAPIKKQRQFRLPNCCSCWLMNMVDYQQSIIEVGKPRNQSRFLGSRTREILTGGFMAGHSVVNFSQQEGLRTQYTVRAVN